MGSNVQIQETEGSDVSEIRLPEAYPIPLGWGGRAQFDFHIKTFEPLL